MIDYSIAIEKNIPKVELQQSHHVVPDFVNGWAFGEALGIGLRSIDDWWVIKEASLIAGESRVSLDVVMVSGSLIVTAGPVRQTAGGNTPRSIPDAHHTCHTQPER